MPSHAVPLPYYATRLNSNSRLTQRHYRRRAAAQLRIVVADSGPGIAEADYGRVQERFVRLDTAHSTTGAGLGLSIIAACVELHHGRLVFTDNKPGLRAALEIACR